MTRWRLLDTAPMSAADNMALDSALLELKARGETPNTLHLLRFAPRAVLVGFHQCVASEVHRDYCRRHGIDINRRITGGGAILMDPNQLGWEMYCDKAVFDVTVPTPALYKRLCQAVIVALSELGVAAAFRPRNDIEVDGRKISGTSGTDEGPAFLFHGTILVDFDVETMLASLNIAAAKLADKAVETFRQRVICLKWLLGEAPAMDAVKAALVKGCEEVFGIELVPDGLSPAEAAHFEERRAYFRSPAWIEKIAPIPAGDPRRVVTAEQRRDGGSIRFTLDIDRRAGRLRQVFVTGDFFSYPPRAVADLEARLRGVSTAGRAPLAVVETFFAENRFHAPGLEAGDFCAVLQQALDAAAAA